MIQGLEIAAGILLLFAVFFDLFQSVILPRPAVKKFALARYLLRALWWEWRWVGNRIDSIPRREGWLASFAPIGVLVMFTTWSLGLVIGYGLVFDGIHDELHPVATNIGTSLYFSAGTLVPLSYGDLIPEGTPARAVTVAESATGVFLAALVITLLFSLYGSFQRREEMVVTLDAVAGAPPSGVQILETLAQPGMEGELNRTFQEWRGWAAAVLESHLAYPTLLFFRSSHDNEAWLNSFGAVMDAAVLMMATVKKPDGPARLMFTVGNHLVEDLAWYFEFERLNDPIVEQMEFNQAWERLKMAGYDCRDADQAWEKFSHFRAKYASALNQLARVLAIVPAQWIGDRTYLPHRGRTQRRLL